MSVVSLLGVNVKNNPAKFTDPYEFEITFECLESLQKDLEWKLTYVGSATSAEHDQELDSLLVGPIPVGVNKFIFEADPPDTKRIPDNEILGVTVILLTCAYDDREFVRVGYYVNNEYDSEELIANPPAKPLLERVKRSILAEKPRVTRFAIKWDSEASAPPEYPPEQPEADLAVDEEEYGAEEAEEEEDEDEAEETAVDADANGDSNMDGVEAPAGEGEASDAESEDIGESDESDEEEAEDEEMDDAMEVDAAAKPEGTNGEAHHADDAMAH